MAVEALKSPRYYWARAVACERAAKHRLIRKAEGSCSIWLTASTPWSLRLGKLTRRTTNIAVPFQAGEGSWQQRQNYVVRRKNYGKSCNTSPIELRLR